LKIHLHLKQRKPVSYTFLRFFAGVFKEYLHLKQKTLFPLGFFMLFLAVLRIRDPGFAAFLTLGPDPGSGIGFFPDPGSQPHIF
jgi:hypothetical protein